MVLGWHPAQLIEYESPRTRCETRPFPHSLSPDLEPQGRLAHLLAESDQQEKKEEAILALPLGLGPTDEGASWHFDAWIHSALPSTFRAVRVTSSTWY